MNFFLILSAKRLKQYAILSFATLCATGIFVAEKENFNILSTLSSQPSAVYEVQTDKKELALTFDISWGENYLANILKELKQNGVQKATFFLSGPWADENPDLVEQIAEAGYEIGNHGYEHKDYNKYNKEQVKTAIDKTHKILCNILNKPEKDAAASPITPSLFRAPNGALNKQVINAASELGYTTIQWKTDSLDWKPESSAQSIIKHVVKGAHAGDIILMHASNSAKHTHEALPTIIKHLKETGYDFVSVSELIAGTNSKIKAVE
ncbi:MAG: putative polysaccharide deacetylase PdaB [Bacillota bacterium]|jgi:polysaccharide deacetylase family sporulation protein PdaB